MGVSLMPEGITDRRNIKDLSIDCLEVAECNLLMSIKGVIPEDVNKQISAETNPISWIMGHCADQMDSLFGLWCRGRRIIEEKYRPFFGYGQ